MGKAPATAAPPYMGLVNAGTSRVEAAAPPAGAAELLPRRRRTMTSATITRRISRKDPTTTPMMIGMLDDFLQAAESFMAHWRSDDSVAGADSHSVGAQLASASKQMIDEELAGRNVPLGQALQTLFLREVAATSSNVPAGQGPEMALHEIRPVWSWNWVTPSQGSQLVRGSLSRSAVPVGHEKTLQGPKRPAMASCEPASQNSHGVEGFESASVLPGAHGVQTTSVVGVANAVMLVPSLQVETGEQTASVVAVAGEARYSPERHVVIAAHWRLASGVHGIFSYCEAEHVAHGVHVVSWSSEHAALA